MREAEGGVGRIETSVLYVQFRASAKPVRELTDTLARRAPARAYVQCLEEVESYYTQMRLRLLARPLQRCASWQRKTGPSGAPTKTSSANPSLESSGSALLQKFFVRMPGGVVQGSPEPRNRRLDFWE